MKNSKIYLDFHYHSVTVVNTKNNGKNVTDIHNVTNHSNKVDFQNISCTTGISLLLKKDLGKEGPYYSHIYVTTNCA